MGVLRRIVTRRERSLSIGMLVMGASGSVSAFLSLALSVVLARVLGKVELGHFTSYFMGVLSLALFSDVLGFYFAAAYLVAGERHAFPAAVVRGTALAYGTVTGGLMGLLVGMTPFRGLAFPLLAAPTWGVVLLVGIAANAALNQLRGLLIGQGRFVAIGLLNAGQTLVFGAFALGATLALGERSGLAVSAAHASASAAYLAVVTAVLVRRGLGRPSWQLVRAERGVGLRAALVNALGFLLLRVDQYLVPYFLGAAALGLYGVAVSVGELLTRVPSLTGSVLFPLVAAERDPSRVADRTLRTALKASALVALLAVPLFVGAGPLVATVYGTEYAGSVTLVRWLLPGMVCLSALYILNSHLAGIGYPAMKIYAMLLGLAVNVALNVTLLPRIGTKAASIASTVSYALNLLVTVAYFLWLRRGARRGAADASAPLQAG